MLGRQFESWQQFIDTAREFGVTVDPGELWE
jgi:hypothetical protein